MNKCRGIGWPRRAGESHWPGPPQPFLQLDVGLQVGLPDPRRFHVLLTSFLPTPLAPFLRGLSNDFRDSVCRQNATKHEDLQEWVSTPIKPGQVEGGLTQGLTQGVQGSSW